MLFIYLVFTLSVCLITLCFFAIDKHRSKKDGAKRIPEAVLLSLSALGGGVGALIGIYVLRHKSDFKNKFHFAVGVWLSVALQAAIAIFIFLYGNGCIELPGVTL